MKLGEVIKEGTILVCREEQATICGIIYLKAGSIVKVAQDKPKWRNSVKVYRNIDAEQDEKYHVIDLSKVRLATQAEWAMYDAGIYFVESNTVNNDSNN